jgi:hypothetical protein
MFDWTYNGAIIQDDDIVSYCGFVYIITNTTNNKKYIGKKIFQNRYRVKVKAKTRRKVKIKDSGWRDYFGSSPSLQEDIKKLGESNFRREVLYLCKSKSEMAYLEAKEQFLRGCLETADYYNEHIMVRVRKANLKYAPSREQAQTAHSPK